MPERRQAVRREPIEITLSDGKTYTANPLPWLKAGDLGNEIVRQNADAANEMVRLYVQDDGLPQLEMKLKQKISDWGTVLVLAYPGSTPEEFDRYDIDECSALVLAALEVNHLTHIKHLVDPNFQPPMPNGGIVSSASGEDLIGQKIASIPPSDSTDSIESLPSPSLVVSS
jgi:hypothetical protein